MDFFLRTKKDVNNPLQIDIKGEYYFSNGANDLVVDTNGDFALTQGTSNLSQSMAKVLVTERGANVLFAIYGTLLQSLIGQRLDFAYLQAKIQSELIDGLRIYQFINKDNPNPDEQIDTLDTVRITQISNYELEVQFTVITKSGKTVGSTIQLEV